MRDLRASFVLLGLAFGFLCLQSAFAGVLAPEYGAPALLLPFVAALGASRSVPIGRGAGTAFALGYLMDLFTANALGPFTFSYVVAYLGAKLLGSRFSVRGAWFEMSVSFLIVVGVGSLIHLVRVAFGPDSFLVDRGPAWGHLLASGVVTALLAPVLFAVARRVDPQISKYRSGVSL